MYTVFRQGARYSFYTVVFAFLATVGCSSSHAPQIVPIEPPTNPQGACSKFGGKSSRIHSCPSRNGAVYVSALKDCSISEKFTLQATTRQLFVGLSGLKVVSQEPVTLGTTQTLHSVVQGSVDADPVVMSTFTFRKDNCVRDLVMWRSLLPTKGGHPDVSNFVDESIELGNILITDNHLAEDVGGAEG
jgi:hypothetical protein